MVGPDAGASAPPASSIAGWVGSHDPEDLLTREQLRLYRRTFAVTGLGSLTIAFVLAVSLWSRAPEGVLGTWLAAIVFTLAPGWLLRPRRGVRDSPAAARKRLLGHRAVLFLHALAWAGLWPVMDALPPGPTHDIIAFALVGVLTGVAITLSFEIVACTTFLVVASAPVVVHFAVHGARLGILPFLALSLFAALLAVSAVRGWHGFRAHVQRLSDTRAIADQSRLLEQLLQNTEQGIWFLDNDGLTTDLNGAMVRLLGRSREDVLGRSVFDFFQGEDLQVLERQLELRSQGHKEGYEIGINRPDGSRVDCFNNATSLHDAQGRKLGSVGMWTELTPLKQATRALQSSQAELRAVLETFPGYIAAVSSQGRYSYVNAAMAQLLGHSAPQDIIGRTLEDIIPDRAAERRAEFSLLRQGRIITGEMEIQPANGGPAFTMQNSRIAGPADDQGQFTCYFFGIDITALKEAERSLREAKDEAERANQAKSQFLSQMSHELRTPLNAILGFGQLLASDQKAPLAPGQQLQVQEILAGAQHLLRLINGLLDIGRIEAGRFSVQREPVAVAQVLQDALRLLAPLASAHQVELPSPALFVSGPDTAHVWADRTRLVQVVLNLLGNAIKYNSAGGSVHIECTVDLPGTPPLPSPPEDGGLQGLPTVTIRVIDEGRGLTEDEQARLFEPFERLSAEASRIEGSGIGLALSRRLVQAMGGTIGVDSTPGVGSRFWVCLPQAPGVAAGASRPSLPGSTPAAIATRPEGEGVPAPAPGPGAAESGEPHRTTLLYIEDNPVNTLVMRAMIERMPGVQLVDCEDAETGLQLAAEHRPALILTDLQMPGMDGFELLERLRADPSLKATPVVAISADAMPQTRARGAQAGFDDFLTKPVEMGALQAVVARLLRR